MYLDLKRSPRGDADWLKEVIKSVEDEERPRYGAGAFPYEDPYLTPFKDSLGEFPTGLAEAAANGSPSVTGLEDPKIRHEWTVKPGKRLYNAIIRNLGDELKQLICGKAGPIELAAGALLGAVVEAVAKVFFDHASAGTFWYPLVCYVAVLVCQPSLEKFCKEHKGGALAAP
jgi:hypothetical protein